MYPLKIEKEGSVALLILDNGENKWNLDYVTSMTAAMDDILTDGAITSLIITSSDEKNFTQGIDLGWLMEQYQNKEFETMKKFLYGMNELFKKILTYPLPVIAAINGHAIGNGAIMTCACDFRFMRSDRGFFCFPEVDVSIPFLPGMIAFIKKTVPGPLFMEMALTGKRYTGTEMAAAGVVKGTAEGSEPVIAMAKEFAATIQKKRGITAELKKRINGDAVQVLDTIDREYFDALNLMVSE